MKKIYTSSDYKYYNKLHSINSLKRSLVSQNKILIKRKELQKRYHNNKKLYNLREVKYKNYTKIYAPINFSLIKNPREVILFLNNIEKCFTKRTPVFVVLERITTIGYDALVLLLSSMIKFKANRINYNGDFPSNIEALNQLKRSGFFLYLYKKIDEKETYTLKGTAFHTHAQKNVVSELTAEIISEYSKIIWGETKRCPGVQRTLLELMQNTNNHASQNKQGEKHWWLSVQNLSENKISFSFVDYGVGIFQSLEDKKQNSKFFNWKAKLEKIIKHETNAELLRLILDGTLHRTVTKQAYRGRGLPGVYQVFVRNQISELVIISNNVVANVSKNQYHTINDNFNGTFVNFILEKNNKFLEC